MTNIKLFSDSTCDLPFAEQKQMDVGIVPLTVLLQEKTYQENIDINPQQLLQMMAQTAELPKTAAPSPAEFEALFHPYVERSIPVLYIGLCSALSSTLANAHIAAKAFEEGMVRVVDSLNVCGGIGALVRMAYRMQQQDLPLEEIAAKLEGYAPHYKLFFTVEHLENLHKGGRCTGVEYVMGSMLGVKPIIQMTPEGLTVWKKARGTAKAIAFMLEEVQKDKEHILFSEVHIASINPQAPERQLLKDKLSEITHAKAFYEYDIGCVLTSHCGEGAFGFGYFLDETGRG